MGCLNSEGQFAHWFGNIHFSGPCNRKCYFCIGQHMMGLDALNNLDEWPLKNLEKFIEICLNKDIYEVNVTGTNTDPSLYQHLYKLRQELQSYIPSLVFGIRTNGVANHQELDLFDKISISFPSFNALLYRKIMGGDPPNLEELFCSDELYLNKDNVKINIILGPEIFLLQEGWPDLFLTLPKLGRMGIRKINLREPYGQPHIGDPLEKNSYGWKQTGKRYGMPSYEHQEFPLLEVLYWDVHYVEVESVNLYANGVISETYPITKGYDAKWGKVEGQEHFVKSGRVREQWISSK